jgi:hypothetical protein
MRAVKGYARKKKRGRPLRAAASSANMLLVLSARAGG